MVAVGRIPVQTKSPLSHVPAVGGGLAIRERRGITTEGLAVDPIRSVGAEPASIAGGCQAAQLAAATACNQEPAGVLRVLPDHVDHTVDRVGTPQRCPGSADDLDPVDIGEQKVLHIPKHARKQRCIQGPSIDEDEQLVGASAVEPAGADGPLTRIELRNLQIRGEPQGFWQAGCAGRANVVLRDDLDPGGCFEKSLGTPGDGHDFDVHQLIEGEVLQGLQGIAALRRRGIPLLSWDGVCRDCQNDN